MCPTGCSLFKVLRKTSKVVTWRKTSIHRLVSFQWISVTALMSTSLQTIWPSKCTRGSVKTNVAFYLNDSGPKSSLSISLNRWSEKSQTCQDSLTAPIHMSSIRSHIVSNLIKHLERVRGTFKSLCHVNRWWRSSRATEAKDIFRHDLWKMFHMVHVWF